MPNASGFKRSIVDTRTGAINKYTQKTGKGPMDRLLKVLTVSEELRHCGNGKKALALQRTGRGSKFKMEPKTDVEAIDINF